MITVGEACLLGVVQGLTEFLPVSSSGHLAVLHRFLTPLPPEQTVAIDVALHGGTLVAVAGYFRTDLLGMARAFRAPRAAGWRWRWIWLLALGAVPVAVVAGSLEAVIVESFASMAVVGVCFLVTGTLLFLASAVRDAHRDEASMRAGDALVVGCVQVLALLPGLSRSGSTIAGALFRRIRGDVAARFSFLLGIPVVLAAQLSQVQTVFALGPEARAPLVAGVLAAALSGLLAIWGVLRMVEAGRLHYFGYYTWTLGLAVLIGARTWEL